MYIYLNNEDATFKSKEEYIFDIPGGLWLQGNIALAEFEYTIKKTGKKTVIFYIYCDICDTSFVGRESLPILRRIFPKKSYDHKIYNSKYYIPVSKPWTTSIKLYIKPIPINDKSFELDTFNCTLHIKP